MKNERITRWLYPVALLYLLFLLAAFLTMPTNAYFTSQSTIEDSISVANIVYRSVTDVTYGQTVTDLIYGGSVTQSVYEGIMSLHVKE